MKKSSIYMLIAVGLFIICIMFFGLMTSSKANKALGIPCIITALAAQVFNYLSHSERHKERKEKEEEKLAIAEIQANIDKQRKQTEYEKELQRMRAQQAKIESERKGPDWVCYYCGKNNTGKDLFCPACGNKKKY